MILQFLPHVVINVKKCIKAITFYNRNDLRSDKNKLLLLILIGISVNWRSIAHKNVL